MNAHVGNEGSHDNGQLNKLNPKEAIVELTNHWFVVVLK